MANQKSLSEVHRNKSLSQVLKDDNRVGKRFEDILGENAASFIGSLLSVVNANSRLRECEPYSIINAAAMAATLRLPIINTLGFAYIVPYRTRDGLQAQFQIGWKGLVQLAQRSGQYKKIHAGKVYKGEIRGRHPITGDLICGDKESDEVVGYVAYMELNNGFNKAIYMSIDDIREHGLKYSQSYAYDERSKNRTSVWSTNFDAMAKKTVLKQLLSKYGIMSVDSNFTDMARALRADQGVIQTNGYRYVDHSDNVKSDDLSSIAFEELPESVSAENVQEFHDTDADFVYEEPVEPPIDEQKDSPINSENEPV